MATDAVRLSAPAPARAAEAVVEVEGLRKRYPRGQHDVVAGLSFSVARGEAFGLLGPNGAGKTTTISILTTRALPTAGSARVAGIDVVADPTAARGALAVVPQRNNLDRSLTVRQNLVFHASYHGVGRREREARADELLAQFGLADRAGDKPDTFSGGQAQRVMIARALMHAPEVLFLDEPSTGLDPAARLFVWDRVRDLKAAGATVVVTTHDMHEAEELCDRVGIMDRGSLLALGQPAELIGALPGERTIDLQVLPAESGDVETCADRLRGLDSVVRVEQVAAAAPGRGPAWAGGGGSGAGGWSGGGSGGGGSGSAWAGGTAAPAAQAHTPARLRLAVEGDPAPLVGTIAVALSSMGASIAGLSVDEPNLEDVYIHHTGRALR